MVTTEREAKEKYCVKHIDYLCEGSSCMAWRWTAENKLRGYCAWVEKSKCND